MATTLTTVEVQAAALWVPTGVELKKGSSYEFMVPPGQVWKDDYIECGPEGFWRWYLVPFQWMRRVPGANWFALIGTIGKSEENPIVIGRGLSRYRAETDGELYCFANDARFAYKNNSGSITLEICQL